MKFGYSDFDLSGIRTYSLESRKSKVGAGVVAKPCRCDASIKTFVDSLPSLLAAGDFKAIVHSLSEAKSTHAGIIWGLGAHVIKTGLGPIVIDLMERGFVSAIAANGATM